MHTLASIVTAFAIAVGLQKGLAIDDYNMIKAKIARNLADFHSILSRIEESDRQHVENMKRFRELLKEAERQTGKKP